MVLIPELKIGLLNAWLPILLLTFSWVMLVIIAIFWTINHQTIKAEERYCLKTYGEEYRKYMDKVPRYIF